MVRLLVMRLRFVATVRLRRCTALALLHAHNQLASIIVNFFLLIVATEDNFMGLDLHGGGLLLLLLLRLEEEALATDWHVGLSAAHQLNTVVAHRAQSETSLMIAKLADSVQLLDFLSLWHQVKDRVESFTSVCAAQSAHNDNLAELAGIFTEIHDIRVELALIHTDHVVFHPGVAQFAKFCHSLRFLLQPIDIRSRMGGQTCFIERLWNRQKYEERITD